MAARRYALLVATGTYDNQPLRQLRSPAHDAQALADVLEDSRIGDFEVGMVVDAPHHEVALAIEHFFQDRRRDDVLLLHISCHGLKNHNGELHFAATDTDARWLASTSVSARFVRQRISECRARSVVLLLDCCYSGAFLTGSKGDGTVHLEDELAGHGRAVLTATNRTEYAWEGGDPVTRLEPETESSRFTRAVIKGLGTGEADRDGDGWIGVHELYDYVYEELQGADVRQRPQMWAELERRVVIARSVLNPRASGSARPASNPAPPASAVVPPVSARMSPSYRASPRLGPAPAPPPRSSAPAPAPPPRSSGPEGFPPAEPPPAHPGAASDDDSSLDPLLRLTEALITLPCVQDPQSRIQFAILLSEKLGRQVDLRGVRLREDAVAIARAVRKTPRGDTHLTRLVLLLEGGEVAQNLRRVINDIG
ncbi:MULTISPECIES: caspase family protein [Streptomyces]|uniref:Caspase family protein n=1 Tax=Streptomyces edwardsiae TaxID=3075527 RepID=A0ABU2PWS8_9ACTN|nr:caspase family protein [Streptomyces sp. DSM 41636]MDT0395190.1 caspase family protein [Streptomyces sp. DSM 41636]